MNDMVIEMSPSVANIASAFIKAKANMGPLLKGASNPFFKSKYADLGSVIEVSEQALLEQGIATIQAPGGDGENVTVATLFLHNSGEWIKSALTVKAVKSDPQAAGSAITYARRYSLQAMCNLAAEDDDGEAARRAADAKKAAVENDATEHRKLAGEIVSFMGIKKGADETVYADAFHDIAQAINKPLPVPTKFSGFSVADLRKFMQAQRDLQSAVEEKLL